MYVNFYQSAMIIALIMSSCVVVLAWRRRHSRGAKTIMGLSIATFVWTLGFFLEANSDTLERQVFFNAIGYLGSMSVPVAWFVFALQYASGKLVTWRYLIPFCIIPLVTIVLVWSNNWHHLMWTNEHLINSGPFLVTAKTYGPFFWVALTYNYALVLAGAFLLMRRLFVGTPLYKGQAISLLVAAGLPLVWNIIYVFDLVPFPRKDLTPAMFAVSGMAITLGVMSFRLLTAVPFARRFIVEQLSDGVFVFNTLNRLLEVNRAALKITGMSKNIIGKELTELSRFSTVFERLSPIQSARVELPLRVSGESRFYELETVSMRDNRDEPVGWVATLRDITERKKMQEQIIAQDRLASIGQLASGIAHEINNPLTPILGFTELLLKRELPNDIKSDLKVIYENTRRAASVVGRLLTFSRQSKPALALCRIDEVIESAIQLRAYQLEKDGIKVIREYAPQALQTLADATQLEQVFLNLIMNAEYEMCHSHGGGNLLIKTEESGEIIRASVKDDGRGISKENMDRLFTPFFSTKPVGEGTGLGLSICHGIIAEHGGRIFAESEPGMGATLIVELPRHHPLTVSS
ncbi:MAG: histidine kinase N-terminal 7TM domain-containing protein [Chloroflexota bacterium]